MSCRPCPQAGCWQQGPLAAAWVPAPLRLHGPPARFRGRAGSQGRSLGAAADGHLRLPGPGWFPARGSACRSGDGKGHLLPPPNPAIRLPARSLPAPCPLPGTLLPQGQRVPPQLQHHLLLGVCGHAAGPRHVAGESALGRGRCSGRVRAEDLGRASPLAAAAVASMGVWVKVGMEEMFLFLDCSKWIVFCSLSLSQALLYWSYI